MRLHWFSIVLMVAALGCGDGEGTPDAGGGQPDAGDTTDGGSGATLMMTPSSHDFGTNVTGSTSAATTFTVGNTGTAPTGALMVSFGGDNPGHFDITADTCSGVALQSATGCEVSVVYEPSVAGNSAAVLRVSGTPGGQVTADVTGVGVAPGALSIAPATNDFGVVALGTTTSATTFTVTNTGGATTGTLAAALSGANQNEFAITTNNCTGALTAGATCTVSVTMTPTTAGAKSASLTVTGNPGGSAVSALTGTGLDPAAITIAPTSHDYGNLLVGATGSQVFTVTNNGSQSTGQLGVATVGGAFSVTADTCMGQVVAAGATCTITVQYTAAAGTAAGSVNVGGMPGGTTTATLAGNGQSPATVEMTPDSHDYGNVVTGVGVNQTFSVTNTGTQPTGTLTAAATGAGFSVTADTCTGQSLIGSATCSVTVRFAPAAPGAASGSVTVTGTPGGSDSSTLTGSGLTPGEISIAPATRDYGDVVVGETASRAFTVTNSGQQTTGFLQVTKTGVDFAITSDTCNNKLVAGGSTCTIILEFRPGSAGVKTGSLSVSGSPGGATTATVTGNGLTPALLAVAPATYDFGGVGVYLDATHAFTVTNNGQQPTSALTASIAPSHFTIVGDSCTGQVLGWGGTCVVNVRFNPNTAGPKATTLTVSASTGGTQNASITGNGVPVPILQISPTTFDFGNVYVALFGLQNYGYFTVTNVGTAVSGAISTDTTGGDFYIFLDYCDGFTLLPGNSCDLYVEFFPETPGYQSTTLSASATPGGTTESELEGTGYFGKGQ